MVSPPHTLALSGAGAGASTPAPGVLLARPGQVSGHVEVAKRVVVGATLATAHDGANGARLLLGFEFGAQLGVHWPWLALIERKMGKWKY